MIKEMNNTIEIPIQCPVYLIFKICLKTAGSFIQQSLIIAASVN